MIGWLKLAAGALVAGAFVWLALIVNGWRADSEQLAAVELERDQAIAARAQLLEDIAEVQEVSLGYQTELAAIRGRAARQPARVVRLCPVPPAAGAGPLPRAEPGPDAAAAAAGQLPQEARGDPEPGPDIGADLFAEADRADAIAAQARALQVYARGCSVGTASEDDWLGPVVEPDLRDPDAVRRRLNRSREPRQVAGPP